MDRLRISKLRPGIVLDQPLFSCAGQKLLNAGVAMSERHIQALQRCGEVDVFAAQDLAELVEAGVVSNFDSSSLQVGKRADRGVMSHTGQVILEEGQEIEAHHIDALAVGGRSYAAAKSAHSERRERIALADTLVDELLNEASTLVHRIHPSKDQGWVNSASGSRWPDPEELVEIRSQAVDELRICYAQVEAGVSVPARTLQAIVDDLTNRLAAYPTRFTQLALLCPRREDYLPDHAYTVTVLAMAIALQLKWSRRDIQRLGLAGLVYDLGMLLVPERIRIGACELTDIDRSRVQRHPVFSLAMLQNIQTIEPTIQLAAYEHHERENGSGYPRGIRKDATCDFARVLAVADSFAATTEPRHYRKPKLPYVAMEETLRSTSALTLWKPAVRALLQAAGLFPVGSYVKLSDGSNAHVLASNPVKLDRPVLGLLDPEGSRLDKTIDLAQIPPETLSVARPIASPIN